MFVVEKKTFSVGCEKGTNVGRQVASLFTAQLLDRVPTVRLMCEHGRHRSLGTATVPSTLLDSLGTNCALYLWDAPDRRHDSRLCSICPRHVRKVPTCWNAYQGIPSREFVSLRQDNFTSGLANSLQNATLPMPPRLHIEDIIDWIDLDFLKMRTKRTKRNEDEGNKGKRVRRE